MAGIKQAAKWMREGKKVRRACWPAAQASWFSDWGECVMWDGRTERRDDPLLECCDLLATDWNIAE